MLSPSVQLWLRAATFLVCLLSTACGSKTSPTVAAAIVAPITQSAKDTQAPVVSISSPTDGSTQAKSFQLAGSATDNVGLAKYECYVDFMLTASTTSTAGAFSFPVAIASLSVGKHTLLVKGYDAAANMSWASITVNIPAPDLVAPTMPQGMTATATGGTGLQLTWTASTDNVAVTTYLVDVATDVAFTTFVSGWNAHDVGKVTSVPVTALASGKKYYARVSAVDAAGNTSPPSATASTTTLDTVAPVVSITSPIAAAHISSTTTLQGIATDNVAVTKLESYVDGRLLTTIGGASPYTLSLTGAALGVGSHTLSVKAYDAAANVATASVAVTVSDGTAPSVPQGVTLAPLTGTSMQLRWSAATDNVAVTNYVVDVATDAGFTALLAGYQARSVGNVLSLTIPGVVSASRYYARVSAQDAAGNISARSAVATTATPDVNPPVLHITNLVNGTVVTGYAQIQGSSTDNVGVTKLEFYVDTTLFSTVGGSSAFAFTLNTTPVTFGYHTMTVKGYDAAGNVGTASVVVYLSHTSLVICPGVMVGQDAAHPAAAGIQQCINNTPVGGTLALPTGIYYLENEIVLNKSITLTSQAAVGNPGRCYTRNDTGSSIQLYDTFNTAAPLCATLVSTADLQGPVGDITHGAMLFIGAGPSDPVVSNVVLDHMILDGNRNGRSANNTAYRNAGNFCHNVHMYRCEHCTLTNDVFAHSMAGYNTVAIDTDALTVVNSLFWDSGYAPYVNDPQHFYRPANVVAAQTWSNGFEVQANDLPIRNLQIYGNDSIDSTDGSFCFASSNAPGMIIAGDIHNNYVAQINNQNWETTVLWNTRTGSPSAPADMGIGVTAPTAATALMYHDNFINCDAASTGERRCSFGIQMGGQYESATTTRVAGAWIFNNTVVSARVAINVDGAGVAPAPGAPTTWMTVVNSPIAFNIAPESGNANFNQEFNAVSANQSVGADGTQVGNGGFYGANLVPGGWTNFDTSQVCATPVTGVLVPDVFGTCPWFPAP